MSWITCPTCLGVGQVQVDDRPVVDLIREAKTGDVLDLTGRTLTGAIDFTPTATDVTIIGLTCEMGLRLRDAVRWTIRGCEFTGTGALSMIGGDGWTVDQCRFHDTVTMAQMQVAWNAAGQAPTNWTIRDTSFVNQSQAEQSAPKVVDPYEGGMPPYQTDGFQSTQLYIHTFNPGVMNGLIEDCQFAEAPWGANLKMGGTSTFSGYCQGVTVRSCSFRQSNGKGTNILLPGYSQANVFEDCATIDGNQPFRVLTVNGPGQALFQRCTLAGGPQVVSVSAKSWSLFGKPYPMWWYTPHSDLTTVPPGTSVEGVRFT